MLVSETGTPVKVEMIHKVFQSSEDLLIGFLTSTHGWYIKKNLCSLVLLAGGLGLLTESVSELPADDVKMPHPTGAGGLPPLGGREAAGGAHLLLDVEGDLAAPPALSVRLV